MYQIKSRIWLEGENGIFLGEGRIQLLKAIETEGSLSKAAKSLNMSYKKAWNLIDAINKASVKPLVIKSTGGAGGGGTCVTEYGKLKIVQFETLKKNCWEFMESQNKLFNNYNE
ncbi:winged helix-turn-helix domain-containing protein [Aquimarina agarivorans]|uniref:winged helix-turn-helix domain-containing protein n=1 Tax=Aquimarina agarivorans TaxID=980584 RepID=UPI000248E6D4|nr:LysR family transcriptional regulator [Aquimarina agarivorans]